MGSGDLHLDEVFSAARRIAGLIRETPMVESPGLAAPNGTSDRSGAPRQVFLKLESLQNTGAFKVRGAANRILSLSGEESDRGVITFSTGNHGKAVAFVAHHCGIPAVVCVSEHVPPYRVERIRALGAEVVVRGASQDEAEAEYFRLMKERNLVPVVPFDDPRIIAGQGTIALEMLRTEPGLDTLLVPLSGGGLLAGVSLTAKLINPDIRIVGVSISRSPAMLESLNAGRPVAVEERETLADSLLGGIGVENRYTLPIIRDNVDEHVLIDEEEIERAMFYALAEHSLVIEGGAAVGIAALQSGKVSAPGERVGIVISGSSVNLPQYLEVVRKFV
ncbi:MAG: threonine/serine dehydratase [Spirochaetaceae bacterium]|nr:MAG: threonine/serine dehydratase [Spirochaetaceae bacterium]